jgi:hypothetical protein
MKLKDFLKQAKALFSSVKLTQEPLIDQSLIQYDGDELEVGSLVYLVSGAGEYSILPDGGYETKRGLRFVIKEGVVVSIDKTAYIPPTLLPDPLPQGQSNVASSNYAKANPEYGDVEYADPGYQTDKKKRYPIDTEEHIRAAWNYINKEGNGSEYSADDLQKIKNKIISAWKDKIDPKGPPSAQKQNKEQMSDKTKAKPKDKPEDVVTKADSAEPGGEPDGDELTPGPSGVTDVDTDDGEMDWAAEIGKVSKTVKDIAAAMEDFKKQLGKFSTIETDLSDIKQKVETFSKAPASGPIETSLNPFKKSEGSRALQILNSK